MNSVIKGMAVAAAIVASAVVGLWFGQQGIVTFPTMPTARHEVPKTAASGPIVYYRDPNGRPLYSLTPRNTDSGEPYEAVRASEDVSFDPDVPGALDIKTTSAPGSERKIKYYRNPMGLPDVSPVPKKDSMGMDYIPVYEGEETDDGSVKVSPGKIQRTGVKTVEVTRRPFVRTIETPGVVQLDERRIAILAPRFDGYVVSVGPVTTGTHIGKGAVLATVFGQDVLNQAARLLVERNTGWTRGDEGYAPPGTKNPGGLIGATRRLQNMGVPQEFIDRVKSERRVPDTFDYRSPIDGYILERNWSDGQGFKAGDIAFRIADLSVVWMMADVAEGDIGTVRPGQPVTVSTQGHPGRTFTGKVTIIYPQLMKETRTVRVRIELSNPDRALLPDMYGRVAIATGGDADALTVPSSAVLDSGNRQLVLVDRGEGRYEPRVVKVGRKADGYTELLEGATQGDQVVASGNFLIDAESNLQAALKSFDSGPDTEANQ